MRPGSSLVHVGERGLGEEEGAGEVDREDVRQSSSVSSAIVLSMVIPALLTRMSSRPWVDHLLMVRLQSAAEPTLP